MNGKNLKEIRKSLGLTQTELAKLIGRTSMRTIQNWESDKNPIPDYVEDLLKDNNGNKNAPYFIKQEKKTDNISFENQTIDNKLNMIFTQNYNILDKFNKILDEIEFIKDTLYEENSLFAANFERIAANLHVDLSDENQKMIDRTKESLN